jgi:SAM-dependent methyltransferase
MNLHAIAVGVHWPGRVLRRLRQGKFGLQGLSKSAAVSVDLRGDRDVEWSWVASRLPAGPGEALDFGPGGSHLALVAAQKGFRVTAVDLQPVTWRYTHAGLRFVQGDFLKMSFPKHMFDLVINCSTVEHVGLAGRYGVRHPRPDGDLEAMTYLRTVLKPGGCMVLTIPVGRDTVVGSLHRVYGSHRLERLLHGYLIEDQQYWTKNAQNEWALVDRAAALMVDPLARAYALGCFVLRT